MPLILVPVCTEQGKVKSFAEGICNERFKYQCYFNTAEGCIFLFNCLFSVLLYIEKGLEFWNIDSFYYLTLAKSLVSLNGYNILGMPHARFPFGFPCLHAPVVGIFGYNFFVIQIFLITLAAFALFVCFIFLRRSYNEKTADIAFLLTGISYFFWSFNCNFIISETPYFLFSLLTLITA